MHVEEDMVLVPGVGKKRYYISNRNRGAVIILAKNTKNKFLLQKEYRYPVNKVIYEFPGGMVDIGETPLRGAKREFREETGYRARRWKKIGEFYGSPSRTNLMFSVYVASDLIFVGEKPDPSEFLEHEWVREVQLRQMIKRGKIKTQTVLTAFILYLLS